MGRGGLGHKGCGGTNDGMAPRDQQDNDCSPSSEMGVTDMVHGVIIRHAGRGVETSGGVWQVTGVGEVQVDDVPCQERSWRAGFTKI